MIFNDSDHSKRREAVSIEMGGQHTETDPARLMWRDLNETAERLGELNNTLVLSDPDRLDSTTNIIAGVLGQLVASRDHFGPDGTNDVFRGVIKESAEPRTALSETDTPEPESWDLLRRAEALIDALDEDQGFYQYPLFQTNLLRDGIKSERARRNATDDQEAEVHVAEEDLSDTEHEEGPNPHTDEVDRVLVSAIHAVEAWRASRDGNINPETLDQLMRTLEGSLGPAIDSTPEEYADRLGMVQTQAREHHDPGTIGKPQ